jgi:antitoxin component YwqK of YwqJK toxin-antitoxin module
MILVCCTFFSLNSFSQSNHPKQQADTVFVTYYGKDFPNSNFNANAKVEEGIKVKGIKEGYWTKYFEDGKTPKLIGEYKNNTPNGSYQKFYPSGKIKEKGVFTNHHYTDTLISFFPNGTVSSITVYDKNGKQLGTNEHFYTTGALALSYESKNNKVLGNITWYEKSGNVSSQIYINNKHKIKQVQFNEVAYNANMPILIKGFNAVRVAGPILKDRTFEPNGYNVVYNKQDELYQVGSFKFGTIYNGKVYNYDENGILKSISIYRDGFYFSEGSAN